MTVADIPNHPELPWRCELCDAVVKERDAVFRLIPTLSKPGSIRVARCPACADKERAA